MRRSSHIRQVVYCIIYLLTLRSSELFITILLVQQYRGRSSCLSRQHNAGTGLKYTTNSANLSKLRIKTREFLAHLELKPIHLPPRRGHFMKSCHEACPSSAPDRPLHKVCRALSTNLLPWPSSQSVPSGPIYHQLLVG